VLQYPGWATVEGLRMITYTYDEGRAAEAAAWLLTRRAEPMTFLKLLKLMYMADRQALQLRGVPITGDTMVSMDKGPVLSRSYDLIKRSKDEPSGGQPWGAYVRRPDPHRWLVEARVRWSDGDDQEERFSSLSKSDRDILNAVNETYGAMTESQLIEVGRRLPEWDDPKGSSKPIDPVRIFQAAGMSAEQIEALSTASQERTELRRALGLT
jgi:uncharacterized phage-associated protein